MKKLILFIAFALLFTIFSCTPDEYETTTKKIEKVGTPSASDPGPGDDKVGPPPPPAP
ncbi:hypothetical protein [Flavobacterium johnsoniae]|jgi:hypothetical protein|uniref:Lipoprotein n=1 Tax=Flavobacterium johnsoniae TaxID=986 RepID=A0A1M5J8T8_FLAJO|nr:hypothetical protein [Flavobacterium johnsoniae]SHG36911.1 hypothetical protein SAMN05444388_102426 [Flavobacterium johnsoniae]